MFTNIKREVRAKVPNASTGIYLRRQVESFDRSLLDCALKPKSGLF